MCRTAFCRSIGKRKSAGTCGFWKGLRRMQTPDRMQGGLVKNSGPDFRGRWSFPQFAVDRSIVGYRKQGTFAAIRPVMMATMLLGVVAAISKNFVTWWKSTT